MRHRLFTFIGLLIALSFAFARWETGVQAGIYNASSEITYKEYWVSHKVFTAGCGESEDPDGNSWYLEPWPCVKTINFTIPDDFSQALKVEIYLNLWRNHTGRSAAFRINAGPNHYSNVGYEWSRTPYIATIPKAELRQGTNTLTFWDEAGGYHVHDIAFRIHYDQSHPLIPGAGSDVTPPTGQLTSIVAANGAFLPSTGGILNVDNNQITLNATATGAAYVEFHAFYSGYDEDNDGVFLDWHNRNRMNYNPGGTSPRSQGGTIDHIGTDTNPSYSATWNLAPVPNQSAVKFKLRVVDAAGNVREAAGGVSADFTLARSYSVQAYLIPGFQDAVLHHGGTEPDIVTRYIDLPADLSDITAAYLIGSYWQNPYISINDNPQFLAFNTGEDIWRNSVREVNLAQLKGGQNKIEYIYNPSQISFGQFIEQPGPMIILRHRREVKLFLPVIAAAEPSRN